MAVVGIDDSSLKWSGLAAACVSAETVTLSPNIQTVYNLQTMSRDHLKSVIPIHKYVNSGISCWTTVKSLMDDHGQWLSFNAKLAA